MEDYLPGFYFCKIFIFDCPYDLCISYIFACNFIILTWSNLNKSKNLNWLFQRYGLLQKNSQKKSCDAQSFAENFAQFFHIILFFLNSQCYLWNGFFMKQVSFIYFWVSFCVCLYLMFAVVASQNNMHSCCFERITIIIVGFKGLKRSYKREMPPAGLF